MFFMVMLSYVLWQQLARSGVATKWVFQCLNAITFKQLADIRDKVREFEARASPHNILINTKHKYGVF